MIYPKSVVLEITAKCNLKCKGCALHGPSRCVTRPLGTMGRGVWEKVVKELGSWNRPVSLISHGGGEPLMHPELRDIVKYAKQYSNISVGFLTNGMLINEDWIQFLLSVNIDWLSFSIDGVSPETHRLIRENSDLTVIEKNLKALIRAKRQSKRKKPTLMLNMVAYEEVMDQRQAFIQKWIHEVDSISISHYRNPPYNKRWPLIPAERKPCFLLWSQAVIAWDGRVGLCCEDFDIQYPIGHVQDGLLLDIWNSSDITWVRKKHEAMQFNDHPLCSTCDTWADDLIYENRDDNGYRICCRASQSEYFLSNRKS